MHGSHSRRGPRSLFKKVFFHGLLLIVVVVIAAGFMFVSHGPGSEAHHVVSRLARTLADQMESDDASGQKLQARLDALGFISEEGLAVYSRQGMKLASTGSLPPEPLSLKDAASLEKKPSIFRSHKNAAVAVRIPSDSGRDGAYLLVAWTPSTDHSGFLVALLIIVLVVGLLSLPLARSITKPLERLTDTARKLGAGDLNARSGISRRDEVGVLAQTVDTMAQQLHSRILREKELLADISHEIRTPLSRIKVALELCDEIENVPIDLKNQLTGILEDSDELENLVSDVLEVSRMDLANQNEGGFSLKLETVSVTDLFDQARVRFEETHVGRCLEMDISGDVQNVRVDVSLVKRLFDNLLANAAKYSNDDTLISVTAKLSGGKTEVEVKDEGIGVAPEDLSRLFMPFFRTDRSRARNVGGTGLGLALCKRIVESHGGSISARNASKAGLAVTFTLANQSA